jgi:type II secretory pathway pseudopilin PulG
MTLMAIMAIMAIVAVTLLAAAPSVYMEIQREKELEAIRRGEEIADAIREFVIYHRGTKLPESIDDLLEGLPQGTKKRMILRASSATDPLSEDGKWRLVKPDPQTIAAFAKRVQDFNNGLLPGNPSQLLDRYSIVIVNSINTGSEDETDPTAAEDFDVTTSNTPFIGVASQSKSRSVIAYYGIENHSRWVFTPLFRGTGGSGQQRPQNNFRNDRQQRPNILR